MSTPDHAKAIAALLKALKSAYEPGPPADLEDMGHFVMSWLMWEAPTNRAEAAYKRLTDSVADLNELRVMRREDIAATLGRTYPLAAERAERMTRSMDGVYRSEHAVALDGVRAMGKRDGRRFLDELEGMVPYVSARVSLVALGAHAVPIDDRVLAKLHAAGVLEPEITSSHAGAVLERHVKATDSAQAHALLTAWADDPAAKPAQAVKRGASSKKPGARRASRAGSR